jgi:dihydrofolate reductase
MTIGIFLLTENNYYIDSDGKLPKRPTYDKQLLTELIRGETVCCGSNTWDSLPQSMKQLVRRRKCTEASINLGIATLYAHPPKLLIIVRSTEEFDDGKKLHLTNYKRLLREGNLELYIRRIND